MPEFFEATVFLEQTKYLPVFDVRSPAEYEKGHIPGAHNIPLFSDEERALVGTMYKNSGRDAAVMEGMGLVGPKIRAMAERVSKIHEQFVHANKEIIGGRKEKEALVYCWRGGMRSQGVGWLLEQAGFRTVLLKGGYKSYRKLVLEAFEQKHKINIVGGKTGSGKTFILTELEKLGEQVIDLEGLAHHKGSAFGALGELPQPTQQQFENTLASAWLGLSNSHPVWLEDEALFIGRCMIPKPVFNQMKVAKAYFLEMPLELRVQRLVSDYGDFQTEELVAAINNVRDRLGGQNAKNAVAALESGDTAGCCAILLENYYDKAYMYALSRRNKADVHSIKTDNSDPVENARKMLQANTPHVNCRI